MAQDNRDRTIALVIELLQIVPDGFQVYNCFSKARRRVKYMHTGFLHDPDSFTTETSNNVTRAFGETFAIPTFSSIAPCNIPVFIELHGMLLGLRVASVPHQGDALVHFDDIGVEGWGASNIEVKDLGARLVPNEKEVSKTFGDQ